MRLMIFALLVGVTICGCTTPVSYTEKPLHRYDQNTTYRVEDHLDGFSITMFYSRYQFVPESDTVLSVCKSNLTSLAYEIADQKNRTIPLVNEQRIKVSMGRNGITGITSCSANLKIEYLPIATKEE